MQFILNKGLINFLFSGFLFFIKIKKLILLMLSTFGTKHFEPIVIFAHLKYVTTTTKKVEGVGE